MARACEQTAEFLADVHERAEILFVLTGEGIVNDGDAAARRVGGSILRPISVCVSSTKWRSS